MPGLHRRLSCIRRTLNCPGWLRVGSVREVSAPKMRSAPCAVKGLRRKAPEVAPGCLPAVSPAVSPCRLQGFKSYRRCAPCSGLRLSCLGVGLIYLCRLEVGRSPGSPSSDSLFYRVASQDGHPDCRPCEDHESHAWFRRSRTRTSSGNCCSSSSSTPSRRASSMTDPGLIVWMEPSSNSTTSSALGRMHPGHTSSSTATTLFPAPCRRAAGTSRCPGWPRRESRWSTRRSAARRA